MYWYYREPYRPLTDADIADIRARVQRTLDLFYGRTPGKAPAKPAAKSEAPALLPEDQDGELISDINTFLGLPSRKAA